jgi:anti-sigma factor RsiW
MVFGHVFNQLAAFAEDQLDAHARAHVERHLTQCAECRAALSEIRAGIELAATLRAERMPPEVVTRVRGQLSAASGVRARRRSGAWWQVAAVAATIVAVVGLYWQVNRPWVRLQAASSEPTAFEHEGRELHDRIASGHAPLTFQSTDEQALWQWLDSQRAPVTSMVVSRPAAQRGQFVPIGAAVHELDGVRTSVLSYRIDGRPVTLALASAAEVPNAPAPGWWSKRVMHRRDARGANTLTWTVGGGTYVMVSELGGAGQKACLICHTTARFTDAVMRLSPPAAAVER